MTGNVTIADCRPKQYREEDTHDILGLDCIFVFNIKLLYILKK